MPDGGKAKNAFDIRRRRIKIIRIITFSYSSSYPSEEHVLTPTRFFVRARVFVPLQCIFEGNPHPFLCQRLVQNASQKSAKSAFAIIIMFKRLFGQPSGSVTRGGSRGGDGRPGSTSTGRAAFDAVDKLKDVRLLCPVKSFSLSENPPLKVYRVIQNRFDDRRRVLHT